MNCYIANPRWRRGAANIPAKIGCCCVTYRYLPQHMIQILFPFNTIYIADSIFN